MKKKINGFVPSGNINTLCKREALERYTAMFGKYFGTIGNCILDLNLSGLDNIVLCYTRVNKLTTCEGCSGGRITIEDEWSFNAGDPIWEHIHLNAKSPDFIRVEVKDYVKRLCDNSFIISLEGNGYNRVVGEFCPNRKILITSDWTHDGEKTGFVNTFLSRMEKEGLISPRKYEKKKVNIMLGTDPEFEYIDRDTDEIINCRDAGIRDRLPIVPGGEGRIGHDGAGAQREIRPEPSDTPEGLILNIKKLISAALDEKWSLRGERFSCGGHIHIGGVEESRDFTAVLDHYLGPLNVLNSRVRQESPYGKPGSDDAMRKQPHGIEYRVPPTGWLASEELARITLKIVKLAAQKHYDGNVIELSDSLADDLISLGLTDVEMKTFFKEIDKYKTCGLPKDLKVAWGYKIPPKFVIEFRDRWNEEVKNYLDAMIKQLALQEQLAGNVVFYGLSNERGNVFSVVVSHMRGVELPEDYGVIPPVKGGKNHVGIPQTVRDVLPEATRLENTIKDIVRRTVNPPKERKKKTEDVPIVFPGMEMPSSYYTSTSGMPSSRTYNTR